MKTFLAFSFASSAIAAIGVAFCPAPIEPVASTPPIMPPVIVTMPAPTIVGTELVGHDMTGKEALNHASGW